MSVARLNRLNYGFSAKTWGIPLYPLYISDRSEPLPGVATISKEYLRSTAANIGGGKMYMKIKIYFLPFLRTLFDSF
jgi:hypothetical protein